MITPFASWRFGSIVAMVFAGLTASVDLATAANDSKTASSDLSIPISDEGLPGSGLLRRDDVYQRAWLERRTAWKKQGTQASGAVVFVGDEAMVSWPGGPSAAVSELKVADRAIAGDTVRGVLIRLKEDVLTLNPSAVVLQIGANDLEAGAKPEVVGEDFQHIVQALEAHDPKMPVIVCQVFPSTSANQSPERTKALNTLYLEAVRNHPNITYVETWSLFADATGKPRATDFPDLLHPGPGAYPKWTAALRPVFSTLGLLNEADDSFTPEAGFVSLFNGHDLTGWGFRPTPQAEIDGAKRRDASSARPPVRFYSKAREQFAGAQATPEGRYVAKAGKLIVTTPTEYRKIQQLWTEREFSEDFVLRLEFRATPNTDSGVYLRGPQLQVRDYTVAGPYLKLKNYRPQDWNELEVTVRGNAAVCTCNGEVIEAAFSVPPSGPIGLEGDRGQMEYRRIRVKTPL